MSPACKRGLTGWRAVLSGDQPYANYSLGSLWPSVATTTVITRGTTGSFVTVN
jgi:hypothetical protein